MDVKEKYHAFYPHPHTDHISIANHRLKYRPLAMSKDLNLENNKVIKYTFYFSTVETKMI